MTELLRVSLPFRGDYLLQCLRFGAGSPSLAIVAGLHGTELNGIHAVNLVAASLAVARLRGSVMLFPAVNTPGLDQGTKRWPFDGRDLNRAFPGDPGGSPGERIAHALLEHTAADVCVDVHAASPVMLELPQVRVPLSGREVELGRATGLPVVWRRAGDRLETTGLVGAWRQRGRPALHLLGGRGAVLDVDHSRTLARGLLRLVRHMGILSGPPDQGETVVDAARSGFSYHYGEVGGFWVPEVSPGDPVAPGHLLGTVTEVMGGGALEEVRADRAGVVVTLRSHPMVHARELLVRVGEAS